MATPVVGRTMGGVLWTNDEAAEGVEAEDPARVDCAGDGLCPTDVGLCAPDDGGMTTGDEPG